MYVAVSGYGKARVIQFREEKRIPGTSKKKTKVIKTLGNYERMLAEDPDIIVAFQTLWDPKYHEKGQRKTINRNLFVKINVIHFSENEKRDSAA